MAAKRMPRERKLEHFKIMRGDDLVRSLYVTYRRYDLSNDESVWEYNNIKAEVVRRLG